MTIGWLEENEQEDFEHYKKQESVVKDKKQEIREKQQDASFRMTDDDNKWANEIRKSREQRRLERLLAQDSQAPIPSYAEFFRRQEGRS